MKIIKNIIFTYLLISVPSFLVAQDVFNPYINIQSSPTTVPWEVFIYDWQSNFNPFRTTPGPSYNGEYQILLDNKFPYQQFFQNPGASITVTYTMEAVSFPFVPACAYVINGCGNPSIRELGMPPVPYDPLTKMWGALSNKLPDNLLLGYTGANNQQTLASSYFKNNNAFATSNPLDRYLPHTIIKHTLYAHCGYTSVPPFGPIISSVTWYYDNTRGMMNKYPFCSSNCIGSSKLWDICFIPELLILHSQLHPYNFSQNDQLLTSTSLNYFPFSEIPLVSPCSSSNPSIPTNSTYNFNNSQTTYDYLFPPPYSLVSAPARTERAYSPAGYDQTGSSVAAIGGIKHHYIIDQDIVLDIINPIDKLIFNPSDVTITASDLHFPSGYTFKTIRGVYPSVAEVTRDDTPENGGPYPLDQRLVPVITDLRCEDPLFPHDPAILDDAKYSSLYRLASGSKLTIDPCVTVYDAAFILDAGSTLDFANYNSFRGLPRIAIDRNGGRLIKRFVPTNIAQALYLQNETKTAIKPDSYFIESKIEAGKNVDGNQPPGNFIVDANAGLELVASEYIAFKEGFSAKANSNLSARIDNSLSIPQCRIANSGNRMALNTNSSHQNASTIQTKNTCNISVYPSIFSSNITVDFPVSSGMKKLVIYDALGKIVYHLNTDNFTSPIELSQLNDGIYFVKIESESCNSFSKTIVKNGGK